MIGAGSAPPKGEVCPAVEAVGQLGPIRRRLVPGGVRRRGREMAPVPSGVLRERRDGGSARRTTAAWQAALAVTVARGSGTGRDNAMDGRRFDQLTRAAAAAGSRRQMLRGAAAAVAAACFGVGGVGRTSAQTAIPLGGRCSAVGADAECDQTGTPAGGVPVVCGDNGVARDGEANCCRNTGGVCAADFQCCGAGRCANGICGGGGVSGLPLGSACSASSQCGQDGGSVVCADNGLSRDGLLNCCRASGGGCFQDDNCCGGDLCVDGVCGGSPPGGTLAPGEVCTSAAQCSQSGGSAACADNGLAADGGLNCCRGAGGACLNSAGCCGSVDCVGGVCGATAAIDGSALGSTCAATADCDQTGGAVVCADNGIASDGSLNCCRNAGGACTDANNSAACCGGLYCVSGICTDLAPSGDLPLGSACTASAQCSQTGGGAVCADNGVSADGALNCCRNGGGVCSSTASCCGGLLCSEGVCVGGGSTSGAVSPGGSCSVTSQCSQEGGATVCADNGISVDGGLNCCRNAGGACTSANNSAGCCGGLLCAGGVCQ